MSSTQIHAAVQQEGTGLNCRILSGGFMAAPEAKVADGLLDLVIVKDSGGFKMLDELVNAEGSTHIQRQRKS